MFDYSPPAFLIQCGSNMLLKPCVQDCGGFVAASIPDTTCKDCGGLKASYDYALVDVTSLRAYLVAETRYSPAALADLQTYESVWLEPHTN